MNCLLVPTIALDISLLDRLAASVDHPIRDKVVINNGRNGALDQWKKSHPDWSVLDQDENLGVAGSWNLAPLIFPRDDAWLICNDDIWFNPGFLRQFCEAIDTHATSHDVIRLNETSPYYCFPWTRHNLDDYGTFDENFWVAYHEDCDMNRRLTLAGAKWNNIFQGPVVNHGKPKCGGVEYNALIQGVGLFLRDYWRRKWGGFPQPTYAAPFGACPLHRWTLDRVMRAKIRPLWETFMAQTNPSIYD